MSEKLDTLTERQRDLERELAGLAEAKRDSGNTALGELEQALMGELDQVQDRIDQLKAYLSDCQANSSH